MKNSNKKTNLIKKQIFASILILSLFLPMLPTFAQDSNALQQAQDLKTELERQLQDIENQITDYQNQLKAITGEKNTLQNKIKQLQNQQHSISLQIKSTNLQIQRIEGQIAETKTDISAATAKISNTQSQMSEIIRLINEYDHYSLLYLILSKGNLLDALKETEIFAQLFLNLNELASQLRITKQNLAAKQNDLQAKQEDAQNLLSIKVLQQSQLIVSVSEQNDLLKKTKGKESNYQAALAESKKKADEIRNRLYQLLEVPKQITFGQAVEIAEWASKLTGVRPAFLLAVLTQESNLGKNVGTCNRPGDPASKSWKVIMKPERDQQPFLKITSELGLNPDTTPVSCPMRNSQGKQIGWGGAMGPAQFIPSTWMGYKDKISAITGKSANPWDIRDAFLAAAIKLGADGAKSKSNEWTAAMKYFCGSTNSSYKFYGDNVVDRAEQYQKDIESMR